MTVSIKSRTKILEDFPLLVVVLLQIKPFAKDNEKSWKKYFKTLSVKVSETYRSSEVLSDPDPREEGSTEI